MSILSVAICVLGRHIAMGVDMNGGHTAWEWALFANNCLWLAVTATAAAAVNLMGRIKNAKCHENEWLFAAL